MVISRQWFAAAQLLTYSAVLALGLSLGSVRAAAADDVQVFAEAPVRLQNPVPGGPMMPGPARRPGTIFLDISNSTVGAIFVPSAGFESSTLRSQRVYARRRRSVVPVLAGVAAGYATAAIVARHSNSAETVVGSAVAAGVSVGVLVGFMLK